MYNMSSENKSYVYGGQNKDTFIKLNQKSIVLYDISITKRRRKTQF